LLKRSMTIERILAFAFGLFATIAAALLIADAITAPIQPSEERRRRERASRSRPGEALLGLGLTGLAVALFGTDRWPWGIIAVLAGLVCLIVGAWLNRRLLVESVRHRGAARRRR
jgi:energy-converting hydrogenase Eha subunit A